MFMDGETEDAGKRSRGLKMNWSLQRRLSSRLKWCGPGRYFGGKTDTKIDRNLRCQTS